jgi:regulator of protease activity HflC (stomatin/prohibitin superfamily)
MQTESLRKVASGWLHVLLNVLLWLAAAAAFVFMKTVPIWLPIAGVLLILAAGLHLAGFFIVNPNVAAVLLLFGSYKGTVKENGFHWANPFFRGFKISLKARNLNSERLKVNDLMGNPIEIAAVVVWQVTNTAEALFEVDDYLTYVTVQSESAIRHLASSYPYDGAEHELTLRGATDEINEHLKKELQERLSRAGVSVLEARLSHLAYAPEIAGAMLQRQQATAVVAARQKIVEGAVGMVEMALDALAQKQMIQLDEERKATMVSNLMVVLCSERAAQPIVNAGSLY